MFITNIPNCNLLIQEGKTELFILTNLFILIMNCKTTNLNSLFGDFLSPAVDHNLTTTAH